MGEGGTALVLAAFLQAAAAPPPATAPADAGEDVPPRINSRKQAEINRCYGLFARRVGAEGRTRVKVTVRADGSAGDLQFEPGIVPWQEQTARCVIGQMSFTPGTHGGVAVDTTVMVPIAFSLEDDSGKTHALTGPTLVSTPEEIEDAYRDCYPPGEVTTATPKYRVDFDARGKVMKAELVESSGIEFMDSAGNCVLKRLKFRPSLRDKEAVQSTVTIPIFLRPPT